MLTSRQNDSIMTQTTINTFFTQVQQATNMEEIDGILDNYHPGWRDVVVPEWMIMKMHREWAAVLFQAAYRGYVARASTH
jgi:hypothetical protein